MPPLIGAGATVSTNDWTAAPEPLVARMVIGWAVSVVTAPGVPASVAVPLPWSVQVTPPGRSPVSSSDGAGWPAVVTVKVPGAPATKMVETGLVTVGPDDGATRDAAAARAQGGSVGATTEPARTTAPTRVMASRCRGAMRCPSFRPTGPSLWCCTAR